MKIKVFTTDEYGGIHFSKQELQTLLDEVYREGYDDGKRSFYTWTSPYMTTTTTTNNPIITYSNSTSAITTEYLNSTHASATDYTLTAENSSIEPYKIEFITANKESA